MKSIFQFTHTTTLATAHIIVDGTKFSLVNAQGLPLSTSQITTSDFSPMLVVTAKSLGYKMTGIQHFEIIFEQVAQDTADQIHVLVDAVAQTVDAVAQVIETSAIAIQEMQDDECTCVDQVKSLRGMINSSFAMVNQLQKSLNALSYDLESCMDKLMDASGEVQVAELFETTEQEETRIKEDQIAEAHKKASALGLSSEIKDETFMMPYSRDRKPGIKDRLLISYGKTEYLIIAGDDGEEFTLCQWYDRAGGTTGEYTTTHTNLMNFLDEIEDDMIAFDDENEEYQH